MAKKNTPTVEEQKEEQVIETVAETPAPAPAKAKEIKTEVELKVGQCIIAPVGREDEEIVVTIDNWHSIYNKGKNQGKFVLKAEKKSS